MILSSGPFTLNAGQMQEVEYAFVTSFDEVVVVLFVGKSDEQTIPRQMWSGIREAISPAILSAATILIVISIGLLATVEVLRRRSERLRGVTPA